MHDVNASNARPATASADGTVPAERPRRARVLLTEAERRAHQAELRRLREIRDRELPLQLREARTFVAADAVEEIARIQQDQAVVEAKIARLEELLGSADVVAADGDVDTVAIGCVVDVEYLESGRAVRYLVSGAAGAEAPAGVRAVSAASPIGAALIDRAPGDIASVELPKGRTETLRIVSVTLPAAAEEAA